MDVVYDSVILGPRKKRSILFLVITLFLLLNVSLDLAITSSIFLPKPAFILLAFAVIPFRPNFKIAYYIWFLLLLFVITNTALSDWSIVGPMSRILSGGQLVYMGSISCLVYTLRPLSTEEKMMFAHYLICAVLLVLGLAVLEVLTPVRGLLGFVRECIYGYNSYESDSRDLQIAGFVRPMVFSSEPSHASWGVSLMVLCVLALDKRYKITLLLILLSLVNIAIFASPGAFAAAAAVVALFITRKTKDVPSVTRVATKFLIIGVSILSICYTSYRVLSTRYSGRKVDNVDSSTYIRVVQPFSLAYYGMEYDFANGVGFKGLEAISSKILVFDGGDSDININTSGGMALMTIPIYTGVIGCLLFLLYIYLIIRRRRFRDKVIFGMLVLLLLAQKEYFAISASWAVVGIWYWVEKDRTKTMLFVPRRGSGKNVVAGRSKNGVL